MNGTHGLPNGSGSSLPNGRPPVVPTVQLPAHQHTHHTPASRESSVGPAGSDTSESSVDSSGNAQLKPRKLFRIRSRAGEMTFGKLLMSPIFVNPEQAGYVGFANLPN
ncbi:uncharacterized protein LOC106012943, partial [Aplysia californica]|uniref:Uncharacterized protein LOC106012943 n=1 Tax=Aplysia californica TaxID=6500 RepID=A0ABM1A8E8_APLCA